MFIDLNEYVNIQKAVKGDKRTHYVCQIESFSNKNYRFALIRKATRLCDDGNVFFLFFDVI